MDQNAIWYEGMTRPRPHCVTRGTCSPKRGAAPLFGSCLLWPNGRPAQLLLSTCYILYLNSWGRFRVFNYCWIITCYRLQNDGHQSLKFLQVFCASCFLQNAAFYTFPEFVTSYWCLDMVLLFLKWRLSAIFDLLYACLGPSMKSVIMLTLIGIDNMRIIMSCEFGLKKLTTSPFWIVL